MTQNKVQIQPSPVHENRGFAIKDILPGEIVGEYTVSKILLLLIQYKEDPHNQYLGDLDVKKKG